MTQPTEGDILNTWDTEAGSISLSYSIACEQMNDSSNTGASVLTGTFFCDNTTAHVLPRTPTDVMFAAVIALNAYSMGNCKHNRCGLLFLGDMVAVGVTAHQLRNAEQVPEKRSRDVQEVTGRTNLI